MLVRVWYVITRLGMAVARAWWRLDDMFRVGMRRRSLSVVGRVFDEDWYMKQNPDVEGYDGADMADHFFRHGAYEGRRARFFDSNWYFKAHGDLRWARIDAWSHFKQYGAVEGRAVRYFYVHSQIERFRNRDSREWLRLYAQPSETQYADMVFASDRLELTTRLAVLFVVTGSDDAVEVRASLAAQRAQPYPHVEFLIGMTADVAAPLRTHVEALVIQDARFRGYVLDATTVAAGYNELAAKTKAAFLVPLLLRDRLDPEAMFWMARALKGENDIGIVYADEDRIDGKGKLVSPRFKPAFNYELFLTHNLLGDFTLYHRKLFEALNGFDTDYDGDMHYDLALRASEMAGPDAIRHVPRVLNHVRLAPDSVQADAKAIRRHLERIKRAGDVMEAPEAPGYTRVRRELTSRPKVSLIVPTRDRADLLKVCLDSLTERTTYKDYEVIIVDNGSVELATIDLFASLDKGRFRVIRDDRPFNYSALNNAAARQARGDILVLMNNDIEIVTPDWIEEMLSFAQQPDIGCVGARLWYPDGTIQHAGVLVGFHGVAGHLHKHAARGDTGYADRAVLHQSLSAVTAAVMMVRKEVFEQVGGLDEALEVAFNDVDFCLKVRDAGYRNIYTPYAEMIHYESASRGEESTPEKKQREQGEHALIKSRYGEALLRDPAFSPNLSLTSEDVSFAFPPRVQSLSDLVAELKADGQGTKSAAEVIR